MEVVACNVNGFCTVASAVRAAVRAAVSFTISILRIRDKCDIIAITLIAAVERNQRGAVLIQVDARGRTPIFEQIKNQITELAISGALKPHDQIPSIRGLAQELKLNFNTVKRAYADLEQADVIYTLSGRGSFIAETAVDNTQLKARALAGIITALRIGRANGVTKEAAMDTVNGIYDQEAPGPEY